LGGQAQVDQVGPVRIIVVVPNGKLVNGRFSQSASWSNAVALLTGLNKFPIMAKAYD